MQTPSSRRHVSSCAAIAFVLAVAASRRGLGSDAGRRQAAPHRRRARDRRHDRRRRRERRAGRLHDRAGRRRATARRRAAGQEARAPARRADLEHRLAGHERRGLAEARESRQRAGRACRTSPASSSRTAPTRSRRPRYFLNLVVKSRKPVVLTASMRPSTALSADGPLNFYNAVAVAANKDAAGRGVLVVVNDWIHGASSLTKTSTTAVQTFLSPLSGLIGTVAYGAVEWYRGPVGKQHRRAPSSRSTASPRCRASTSSWPTRTWTAR